MTSVADPDGRRLAAFAVASEPGNERMALARVAEAVEGRGLPAARLERLKTAVAEATMNAIEHGNRGRPEIPVDVEVIQDGDNIVVTISDLGGEHAPAGPVETPGPRGEARGRAADARLGPVPHPAHGQRHGRDDRRPAPYGPAHHADGCCGRARG